MHPIGLPVCARCGAGLAGAFDAVTLCGACRDRAPVFDRARACWWYAGTVCEAIRQFKYHRRWRIGQRLAEDMASTASRSFPVDDIEVVVPVPLHWAKHRLRGFNPAQALAQLIATRLAKPCVIGALRRTRWTRTQTRLHGRERFRNVKDAFAARPERLGRRGVLLVDDVFTSGATAAACVRALKSAGAERIFVLTAARTPLS
jgi:ComF family protein